MTPPVPSRRFLGMLPESLLRGTPPDERPPLLAFLAAVEEQYWVLAAEVDSVLDDAFADSAADWAVPYLGGLLGLPSDASRAEVAYATALRRRKGTPAAVEDFAEIVTGWPARVDEGWQRTVWCQQLRHPARRTASISLRDGEALLAGTGLDRARRSVTPGGPYSPAAVSVTSFPWQVVRFTDVQACPLGAGRYAVHPLGAYAPLYRRPEPLQISSDAEDERAPGDPAPLRPPRLGADLPLRATWALLLALTSDPAQLVTGPVWSLTAEHPLTLGTPQDPALLTVTHDGVPLPWSALGLTALPPSGAPVPGPDQLLVDLYRGVLAPGANLSGTLRATYYRPVTGQLGAAVSDATFRDDAGFVVIVDPTPGAPHAPGIPVVPDVDAAVALAAALPGGSPSSGAHDAPEVEIRLATSDRLAAPTALTGTPSRTRWRLVAPPGATPVLTGVLDVDLAGADVEIAGVYLDSDVRVGPNLAALTLRSVTANPPAGAAVTVAPDAWSLRLSARRSILAAVRADVGAFPVHLVDCLLDAHGDPLLPGGDEGSGTSGQGDPARPAVAAVDRFPPALVAEAVTFVGAVDVDEVHARDSLFAGGLRAVVTSSGALRYCHLGPDDDPQAHPPAYHCLSGCLPAWSATGFEAGGYYAPLLAAPSTRTPPGVLAAASDGGEVGAYHHARRGPLARRLTQRLAEMVPLATRSHVTIARTEE